jgi:hypothetical protein
MRNVRVTKPCQGFDLRAACLLCTHRTAPHAVRTAPPPSSSYSRLRAATQSAPRRHDFIKHIFIYIHTYIPTYIGRHISHSPPSSSSSSSSSPYLPSTSPVNNDILMSCLCTALLHPFNLRRPFLPREALLWLLALHCRSQSNLVASITSSLQPSIHIYWLVPSPSCYSDTAVSLAAISTDKYPKDHRGVVAAWLL